MKKSTIKAFTLVEMLIVIVQTAQWRARDVARKNDLSQIQTAIITSQADRGVWPSAASGKAGTQVKSIQSELLKAGMSEVPTDPNQSNDNYWVWGAATATTNTKEQEANFWQYLYYVWKRNWVADAWFVLMAKTEVEWSSNWVVCADASTKNLEAGYITDNIDLSDITLCKTITQSDSSCKARGSGSSWTGACTYKESGELRYIILY